MKNTVCEKYKTSIHFANASGLRAICSACHMQKEWTAKPIRKIQATGELCHHIVGTIDTPGKFAQERQRPAAHGRATTKSIKFEGMPQLPQLPGNGLSQVAGEGG